jgi:hypothetical protein
VGDAVREATDALLAVEAMPVKAGDKVLYG